MWRAGEVAAVQHLVRQGWTIIERNWRCSLGEVDIIAHTAEQSCHLGVYDRGNITIVAQVASPVYWGLSIRLGARVSLIDTGSGHVLLAFQTEQRRAETLKHGVLVPEHGFHQGLEDDRHAPQEGEGAAIVTKLEKDAGEEVFKQLAARGHEMSPLPAQSPLAGHPGAIRIEADGRMTGAHDPRSDGRFEPAADALSCGGPAARAPVGGLPARVRAEGSGSFGYRPIGRRALHNRLITG